MIIDMHAEQSRVRTTTITRYSLHQESSIQQHSTFNIQHQIKDNPQLKAF